MGLLERHGSDKGSQIRTMVLKNLKKAFVEVVIRDNVELGAAVNSDAYKSDVGLNALLYP